VKNEKVKTLSLKIAGILTNFHLLEVFCLLALLHTDCVLRSSPDDTALLLFSCKMKPLFILFAKQLFYN